MGGAPTGTGGSASAGGMGGVVVTGGTPATGGAPNGSGGYRPHPPAYHRATADPCPPSSVQKPPPPSVPICASDADCNGYLPGGRCVSGGCAYDCMSDRDCGTGVCRCNGSASGDHVCTWAACHIDADCPGSYCSPTFGTCGNYSGVIDYRCHTPEDECTDDSDCGAMGLAGYCMYEPLVSHWVCRDMHCVG